MHPLLTAKVRHDLQRRLEDDVVIKRRPERLQDNEGMIRKQL